LRSAELCELVRRIAPALLSIPDCGVLSAVVMIGETAGTRRFRDKDAFARFTRIDLVRRELTYTDNVT
jgi:transposase